MTKDYHGAKGRGSYFEGWYLKYQARDGRALALIPALHIDQAGRRVASLQLITGNRTWWLEYPEREFEAAARRFQIRVGQAAPAFLQNMHAGYRGNRPCVPRLPLLAGKNRLWQ